MKRLPGEYVYWDEVLPILIIGIAFNLAASYLIGAAKEVFSWGPGWYLSFGHLFQDTSGTCFAALALGPWWGALVGVVSSTLNTFWISEQFGDAFAYTCVQIGLALAWGYAGRAVYADATLIEPKLAELRWRALGAFVVLVLAGTLTATILADQVKLALLEKAGGDIFQGPNAAYYSAIEQSLRGLESKIDEFAIGQLLLDLQNKIGRRQLALGIFDFYANLLDKGLSVTTSLVLLRVIGLIPSPHSLGTRSLPMALGQRFKVGAESIASFFAIYTIYLLVSAFVLQEIHFMHSPAGAAVGNWMPQLAALLLFPFVVGCVVYALLVFRRRRDAYVEMNRLGRYELYGGIRGPNPWSSAGLQKSRFFFVQQNSGYGLIVSLVMWPAKTYLMNARGIWVYFFGMAATSLLFVYERKESLHLFRKAQQWQADLQDSFVKRDGVAHIPTMIALFFDIFRSDLSPGPGGQRQIGRTVYQIAVNSAESGWLNEMRTINEVDHLLLIAAEGVQDVDSLDACLTQIKEQLDIHVAVLLCVGIDASQVRQLRDIRRATGCDLIVLEPGDMRDLIAARSQGKDLGTIFARSRVSSRFARMLEIG
jgi:hypothetical protein